MFFKRIKELREDKDFGQKEVAAYLGIPRGTYRNYENGYRKIPAEILVKLAEFYNVSVDYLLEVSDKKERE